MHSLKLLGAAVFLLASLLLKVNLQKPLISGLTSASRLDLEPLQVSYQAESLKKLAFGYENFLSSLIWIRLLQLAQVTPLKTDTISWEFSEVNSVTTLDPKFDIAFSLGAIYVSFFRRDKEGGLRLLQKWVRQRPHYWKSHHLLGMHYYLELNDFAKAAPHILKASQLPGSPAYLSSLGIRLLSETGALGHALESALELFQNAGNGETRLRLLARIRSIRWNLEKQKWEAALIHFKTKHSGKPPKTLTDLIPYIYEDMNREIASLFLSKNSSSELKPLLSEVFRFQLSKEGTIEPLDSRDAETFSQTGVYLPKEVK